MTYKDLQKGGKLIRSFDKYGQGPYDVYAGNVEIWAIGNDIYTHETNRNDISYTGRSAVTSYLTTVNDIDVVANEVAKDSVDFTDYEEKLTVNNVYKIILAHSATAQQSDLYVITTDGKTRI